MSCSYEKTSLNLNSQFSDTWSFSESTDYNFNTSLIEVTNGKAQLKPLDFSDSGSDFDSQVSGTTYLNSNQKMTLHLGEDNELSEDWAPNSSNVIAYWSFNESSLDALGNNNCVASNNEFYRSGQLGQSVLLDGVNDHYNCGNHSSVQLTSEMSVSAWVKITEPSSTDNMGIIAKYVGQPVLNQRGYNLNINYQISNTDPRASFLISTDGTFANTVQVLGTTVLEVGQWYHLVATFDPGVALTIYVNGSMEARLTTGVPNEIHNSTEDLVIGNQYNYSQASSRFAGFIDEVVLWDRLLSESDVLQIYERQSPSVATDVSLQASTTPHWAELIGYWPMESSWRDMSGQINHGLSTAGPSFSENSKVGEASGLFDGASGEVESTLSTVANTDLTVAFWIKANSTGGQNYALGLMSSSGENIIPHVNGSGEILLQQGGAVCATSQTKVIGAWHHIAFTRHINGFYNLYINGQLEATCTDPDPVLGGVIRWGAYLANPIYRFNGHLDELAVWRTGLTGAEINQLYNKQKQKFSAQFDSLVFDTGSVTSLWPDLEWQTDLPFGKELIGDYDNDGVPDQDSITHYPGQIGNFSAGMVAYWKFNEAALGAAPGGSDIEDHSGNNHHGTEVNTPSLGRQGRFGSSAGFNGTDQYFTVPHNSELVNSAAMTFSAWVKPEANGTNKMILNNRNGTYYFKVSDFEVFCFYLNGATTLWRCSTTKVSDGRWHHVVASYSTSELKVYVDGVLELTAPHSGGAVNDPARDLEIGRRANATVPEYVAYYQGEIDELALWSRVLTDDEVVELYRRGANRVKVQMKSCIDKDCFCKSYSSSPQGLATDCDGDGTPNAIDFDDLHKAEFIGPGGSGETYYSETWNRNASDISFNCALNTNDSDPGVCVGQEIAMSARVKETAPSFVNLDHSQFIVTPSNRYVRYRLYLEADDNKACGGNPCFPEISSVQFNNGVTNLFASEHVLVQPKEPIVFSKLISINIKADPCASFRLVRKGVMYYHDSSSWVIVTDEAHRNTSSELVSHVTEFARQYGAGELEIFSYLKSDMTQSQQCSIDSIDVRYLE